MSLRQHHAATPAAVDVHPDAVTLAHVSDGVQRVEGAENGRTGSGYHQERSVTLSTNQTTYIRNVQMTKIMQHNDVHSAVV